MNFRGYLNTNDYLQFRTGNNFSILEQYISGELSTIWQDHALSAVYVYTDITTTSDSAAWGGNYRYFDINSNIKTAIGDVSRVVAIIPLCAIHKTKSGTLALIGNYTYAQVPTNTAFVINTGVAGDYRAKFLVLYR